MKVWLMFEPDFIGQGAHVMGVYKHQSLADEDARAYGRGAYVEEWKVDEELKVES